MEADAELKIGDVARLSGLSIDTVRFYEKAGLLGTIRRTAGIRRYGSAVVRRLDFVRSTAALGFSLAEIRGLLALRVSARTSCDKVRERALTKRGDVDARIAELVRVREALTQIANTCGSAPATSCPLLDALDRQERP